MSKQAPQASSQSMDQLYDDFGNPIQHHDENALYDDSGNLISQAPLALGGSENWRGHGATGSWGNNVVTDPGWTWEEQKNREVNAWNDFMGTVKYPFIEGGPVDNLGKGFLKGAAQTATGLGKMAQVVFDKINPGNDPQATETFSDLDKLRRDLGIEPEGTPQHLGFFGERVAEAFIPAGKVEAGIQMIPKGQRFARLLGIMGLEGLAGFGTTMAQTGGDVRESTKAAAFGAGARGLFSLPAVFRARPKEAQELMELAAEFGIPLDKAQQTQSGFMKLIKGVTKSSATGSIVFNKFDLAQNKKIAEAAAKQLVDLTNHMDPKTAGEFVQEMIAQTDRVARQEYAAVVDDVLSRAGKTELDVSVGSNLQSSAESLLREWKLPFMEGSENSIDDISKAKSLLERFVNVEKPTGLTDSTGRPIMKTKSLTFEEAKKIRTLLYNVSNSDEVTIGKGAIKRLNHALDEEIAAALERSGQADEARLFRAAGARFRQTRELLEEKVIEQMAKSGTPETILDTLLRPGAETRADMLRRVIHKEGMEKIRAALWARMLDPKSSSQDGVLLGGKLKKMLDDMGPGAKEAIFGSKELVKKVERFVTLADRLRVPANLPQRIEQGAVPLAGQFGARSLAGNALTGIISAGAGATGGLMLGAGTAVAMVLTPGVIARMMTRPGVADDMVRALKTDPVSSAGKVLLAKLVTYAKQAMSEERKADPIKDMHDWMTNPNHPDRVGDSVPAPVASGASATTKTKDDRRSTIPPPPAPDAGKAPLAKEREKQVIHPDEFNREAGSENEHLIRNTTPQDLLPSHFARARKVPIGMERKSGAVEEMVNASGLYGDDRFTTDLGRKYFGLHEKEKWTREKGIWERQGANPAIILGRDISGDSPYYAMSLVHELGHAAWWLGDVTGAQKSEWTKIHNARMHELNLRKGAEQHTLTGRYGDLIGLGKTWDPGVPASIEYYGDDPSHSFVNVFADYVANPKALKENYGAEYAFFKRLFKGREYLSQGPKDIGDLPPGTPAIPPPPNPADTERYRRQGFAYEWPKDPNGKDENHDLVMSDLPRNLIPARFHNARNVTYATPITKDISVDPNDPTKTDSRLNGLFGRPIDPRPGPLPRNTVLVRAGGYNEPAIMAHETFHSMWAGDLSAKTKENFGAVVDKIADKFLTDLAALQYPKNGRNTRPYKDLVDQASKPYPKAITTYSLQYSGNSERIHSEAFAELGGQYMMNPTAFKKTYPEIYNWFKRLLGREYINVKPRGEVAYWNDVIAMPELPKR